MFFTLFSARRPTLELVSLNKVGYRSYAKLWKLMLVRFSRCQSGFSMTNWQIEWSSFHLFFNFFFFSLFYVYQVIQNETLYGSFRHLRIGLVRFNSNRRCHSRTGAARRELGCRRYALLAGSREQTSEQAKVRHLKYFVYILTHLHIFLFYVFFSFFAMIQHLFSLKIRRQCRLFSFHVPLPSYWLF